jgi:hypothetical protein
MNLHLVILSPYHENWETVNYLEKNLRIRGSFDSVNVKKNWRI